LAGAAGFGLVVVVGAAVVGGAVVVGAAVVGAGSVVGAAVDGAAVVGGLVEVTPRAACPWSSLPPAEHAPKARTAASPAATTATVRPMPAGPRLPVTSRLLGATFPPPDRRVLSLQWYQSNRTRAVSGL
jgi:hypothetical protein